MNKKIKKIIKDSPFYSLARAISLKLDRIRDIKLKDMPDKQYLEREYRRKLGLEPNFDAPVHFNEKINWLKLNDRRKIYTICADKYAVRDYVSERGYGHTVNRLIGVWDDPEKINFEALPNRFVLKVNSGSGWNIICRDKKVLDIKKTKKQLRKWLDSSYFLRFREFSYKDIDPKIICEEYLEQENGQVYDYKFFCFNGEPHFIELDTDRFAKHKRNIYDMNWNMVNVKYSYKHTEESIEKPLMLDEMINMARALSEEFPFARVDLMYVGGKIYFGEITFYPDGGFILFDPPEFEMEISKLIRLDIPSSVK